MGRRYPIWPLALNKLIHGFKVDYSRLYQKFIKAYSAIPMALASGYTFPAFQVFFEVTYSCNLKCSFCQFLQFQADGRFPLPQSTELTIGEFKNIIERMPGSSILSFTGGEPFVKKGFLDLLDNASRKNRTHIFTNGTLITDTVASHLIQIAARHMFDKGLVLIGISLEGIGNTHDSIVGCHGAYRKTLAGLGWLLEKRRSNGKKYPIIELKVVISDKNVGQLNDLFDLAKRLGVDIFNLMTLNMLPHASRVSQKGGISYFCPPPKVKGVDLDILQIQLERIRENATGSSIQIRTTPQGMTFNQILDYYAGELQLQGCRCYYPWYGMGVTAHGDVLICPYVITGNVRDTDIRTLTNSNRARSFRKALKNRTIFPGCSGCCMVVQRR